MQLGFDADLNPMMKMMASKPLTNFLNLLVKKLKETQEALRKQWELWDSLSLEKRKFYPELEPKLPRPKDEK